jgi:prophage antirepressor-like protein
MEMIPFEFENNPIRVVTDENGEPLFVGKDICQALGYANDSDAMKRHCKGVVKRYSLLTPGGKQDVRVLTEPDVLRLIVSSTLPAAEAFERLVFEEILPTIRKTGSYTAPSVKPTIPNPAKEFRAYYGIARLIGMDKNAAAISANQAARKLTGTNVLDLIGHVHLEAERQTLHFTPTELGKRIGVSGQKFNALLAEAGLQAKKGDCWIPSEVAEDFCRILDTGKRHGDGTMIQQIKWAENVLSLVGGAV